MTQMQKPKLIVFDVEGVLIPKNRFLFELGRNLGFFKLMYILFMGLFYELGFLSLESALRRIFKKLEGVKLDQLVFIFRKVPLMPHIQNFFCQIKSRNYKVALISSGLPSIIVKQLADSVGADYAFGIDVKLNGKGELTGEINGDAIGTNGKLKILNQILASEGLTLNDCTVVADDRNNRCIFLPQVRKIGFNPDFIIRIKSDSIVMSRLSLVLPVLDGKKVKRHFPSRNDLVREDIHASGFFVPVIAGLIGVPAVAALICTIAIIYTLSELSRLEGKDLPLISTITRHAASQTELYGFAAAPLYFAFGILLSLLLFPSPISGAAIAMFALGDSTASIFGGLFGKKLPYNRGKTLEGSLAGFFFAFLAGTFFVAPWIALVGAAVAMTIEYLPLPINDNVLIPLVTASVLMLLV
jgi:HAD superfamily phosphoserine phosphatase-like hydrolase